MLCIPLHSIAWRVSFQSEVVRGKAGGSEGMLLPGHRRSPSPLYLRHQITAKSQRSLCVSLPSCGVQEYLEWGYRYGGAPVSCLHRAGGEQHAVKVIPASHFALHLVFIFQAIKPAARRWREHVCLCVCV